MTDEEMEFVRKVNIDKANNKTGIEIVLIVLSMLTYHSWGMITFLEKYLQYCT